MIKKQKQFTPRQWKRNTWQVSYIDNCDCKGCVTGRDIFNYIAQWAFSYSKDGYIGNDRVKFPLTKEQKKQYLIKFPYMSLSPHRRGWFLEQIFLDYNDAGFFLNLTDKDLNEEQYQILIDEAKLTEALMTPFVLESAFSIVCAQVAQCIPEIFSVDVCSLSAVFFIFFPRVF